MVFSFFMLNIPPGISSSNPALHLVCPIPLSLFPTITLLFICVSLQKIEASNLGRRRITRVERKYHIKAADVKIILTQYVSMSYCPTWRGKLPLTVTHLEVSDILR